MKRKNLTLFLVLGLLFLSASLLKGEGKFSGLVFGDYYYVLGHHDEGLRKATTVSGCAASISPTTTR